MSNKILEDNQLVDLYKESGNTDAFGILFERYNMLVFGVCFKYFKDADESKDAVQQIFEKLLVDLKKHEIDNFRPWLHTVSKNHCLMQLRKKSKQNNVRPLDINNLRSDVEFHEVLHHSAGFEKEARFNKLEQAITELNSEQKLCIELFYMQDKSYVEIVEITGFTANEVKSFIQNGKRNLKIKLENLFNEQ